MSRRYSVRLGDRVRCSLRNAVRGGLAVILICFSTLSPAGGSVRSGQLIDEGLVHLGRQENDLALAKFRDAARADPADPDPPFFIGTALNTKGEGGAALQELRRSRQLGCSNPDLSFEMGWALLLVRDWPRAAEELEAYEKAYPGRRAQASLFLARSYRELKVYDRANAALRRAIELAPGDADLTQSVEVERVRLAQARGDQQAAAERLKNTPPLMWAEAWRSAGGPGGGAVGVGGVYAPTLRPDMMLSRGAPPVAPPVGAVAGRRGWGALSLGGGYDTDARGFEAFLQADVAPGAQSAFAEVRASGGYDLLDGPDRRLWLGYRMFERAYFRRSIHADLLDQELSVTFEQQLGTSLRSSIQVTDEYTLVNYESFRNEPGARAALSEDLGRGLQVELSYTYAHDDYLFRTRPVAALFDPQNRNAQRYEDALNRDAENHVLTLAARWTVPGTAVQARAGASHSWNFARHSDFVYQGNGLFAGINLPLPFEITADVAYSYTLERYAHVNEEIPKATHRRDPINVVTVGLSRPLTPHVTAYLEYGFTFDRSNVGFYNYREHVVSCGLTWAF